jgi:plastocyanin
LKSKKQLTNIVLAITIIVGTIAVTAITMSMTTKFQAVNGQTTIMVYAGGGNSTNMLAAFVPQQVQISVGQSITWDNPSPVPEPHTVTFVLNDKTMTTPDVPFIVRSSTQFMPVPGANSQPNMIPGKNGMNAIIVSNVLGYYPTLIDLSGHAKVLGPNGNFTITGNERYIISGWLLPKATTLYPGSSNAFTVTFQKAGTYNYLCEIRT